MNSKIVIVVVVFMILFFGLLEKRSFYRVQRNNYITVWKTVNNVCFIIPGKYYGLFKPPNSYIETTNTNNLTIFFTDKSLNTLIYKREGDLESKEYLRVNNKYKKNNPVFVDYDIDKIKWNTILYKTNAKNFGDLKNDADFIEIIINENYAIDKKGNEL